MESNKEFLSAEEISKLTGFTISTIKRYARTRRIPSYRFGYRTVKFKLPEVQEAFRKFLVKARS